MAAASPSSAERRRAHPPTRIADAQRAGGRARRAERVEQRKTRCARPGHAREPASRQLAKHGENLRDCGSSRSPARGHCDASNFVEQIGRLPGPCRRRTRPAVASAEHVLVATATPGLTSTANSRANRADQRISPTPRMKRGRRSRHAGTSAPVERTACMGRASSGARPFARASKPLPRLRTAAGPGRNRRASRA